MTLRINDTEKKRLYREQMIKYAFVEETGNNFDMGFNYSIQKTTIYQGNGTDK